MTLTNYILDAIGNPVPEPDVIAWGRWFGTANRHVAQTDINGVHVSTVFLGVDHNFTGHGDPILFETMPFADDSPWDQLCWRHPNRHAALAFHDQLVAAIRDGKTPDDINT